VLGGLGIGVAGLGQARGARAQQVPTASQIEGPFYPYDLPREHDSDLVRVGAGDAEAMGQVTHVFGTVWTAEATPLAGALIEIWQCDAHGRYRHPEDLEAGREPDLRFQGYGRAVTGRDGSFRFRTIRPVSYAVSGTPIVRAPHIHVAVSTRGIRRLTSQLYVAGEPLNDSDIALSQVTNPAQRAGLIRPYEDGGVFEAGAQMVRYDLMVVI
jgi:protocatechuate 3,4-dioxygenase beta subunit